MKEFISIFQLDRLTLFNVEYYTLGSNERPHFSTSADHFIRNKRDFDRCGQAQRDLLQNFPEARNFWLKWDKKHLKTLTKSEYDELLLDLETLKRYYNYIIEWSEEDEKIKRDHFSFYSVVEFSKQKVKKV